MKKFQRFLVDYLIMTVGVAVMTVGVYFFKIPNGFATGGVSGISTVLGKLVPNVSTATWIVMINALILVVGFIFLGKDAGIKTVYCSILFSAGSWLLEYFFPLDGPLTDQPFLELFYAMLLSGIGSVLLFNKEASSGGTDIIALILKKYTNLNAGKALLCTDSIIALSSFFVFGIEIGLFSVFGLFVRAFLIDGVIDSISSCKYFIVITENPKDIEEYIAQRLNHGITVHRAVGYYTNSEKTMIHTVCKRAEAIRLRKEIKAIDPNAFIIITTTNEVIGRGFRSV